jgi:CHASE3 domain sensor protein
MNGGTYHHALNAKFTETQAVFLSNLGAETRQEAVDEVFKTLQKMEAEKQERKERRLRRIAGMAGNSIFWALIGGVFGIVIAKTFLN